MRLFIVVIVFLINIFSGCDTTNTKLINETGTIIYLDFEGGFYGISGDDSVAYDPSNLPENFKQDRLRVKFIGKIDGGDITHMWGIGIELLSIEKIPSINDFKMFSNKIATSTMRTGISFKDQLLTSSFQVGIPGIRIKKYY